MTEASQGHLLRGILCGSTTNAEGWENVGNGGNEDTTEQDICQETKECSGK